MFMYRQTGNLRFILIEKGREKKGWGNTLRQKGDFLGCFYSKSWCSPLFSSKSLAIQNKSSTFAPPEPAKPLNDAQMCGSFCFIMAHYTKTYSSPAQLVTLLQSRGLHVENVARTENYLRHIGYYRFSAYLYPLLTTPKENHVFKPGATFNQALDMYRFDRQTWRQRLMPSTRPLTSTQWASLVGGRTSRCGDDSPTVWT